MMTRTLARLVLPTLVLLGGPIYAAESPPPLPLARPFPTPRDERQPTLRGLPPAVARSEGQRTASQKALDKALIICSKC